MPEAPGESGWRRVELGGAGEAGQEGIERSDSDGCVYSLLLLVGGYSWLESRFPWSARESFDADNPLAERWNGCFPAAWSKRSTLLFAAFLVASPTLWFLPVPAFAMAVPTIIGLAARRKAMADPLLPELAHAPFDRQEFAKALHGAVLLSLRKAGLANGVVFSVVLVFGGLATLFGEMPLTLMAGLAAAVGLSRNLMAGCYARATRAALWRGGRLARAEPLIAAGTILFAAARLTTYAKAIALIGSRHGISSPPVVGEVWRIVALAAVAGVETSLARERAARAASAWISSAADLPRDFAEARAGS